MLAIQPDARHHRDEHGKHPDSFEASVELRAGNRIEQGAEVGRYADELKSGRPDRPVSLRCQRQDKQTQEIEGISGEKGRVNLRPCLKILPVLAVSAHDSSSGREAEKQEPPHCCPPAEPERVGPACDRQNPV